MLSKIYSIYTSPFTVMDLLLGNPLIRTENQIHSFQNASLNIIGNTNGIKHTYGTILNDNSLPSVQPNEVNFNYHIDLLKRVHTNIHNGMVKKLKNPYKIAREIFDHRFYGSTILWSGIAALSYIGFSTTAIVLYTSANLLYDIYERSQISEDLDHNDKSLNSINNHINSINIPQQELYEQIVKEVALQQHINGLEKNLGNVQAFQDDLLSPKEREIENLKHQLESFYHENLELKGDIEKVSEENERLNNKVNDYEKRIDIANEDPLLQAAKNRSEVHKKEMCENIDYAHGEFLKTLSNSIEVYNNNIRGVYQVSTTALAEKHQDVTARYEDLSNTLTNLTGSLSRHASTAYTPRKTSSVTMTPETFTPGIRRMTEGIYSVPQSPVQTQISNAFTPIIKAEPPKVGIVNPVPQLPVQPPIPSFELPFPADKPWFAPEPIIEQVFQPPLPQPVEKFATNKKPEPGAVIEANPKSESLPQSPVKVESTPQPQAQNSEVVITIPQAQPQPQNPETGGGLTPVVGASNAGITVIITPGHQIPETGAHEKEAVAHSPAIVVKVETSPPPPAKTTFDQEGAQGTNVDEVSNPEPEFQQPENLRTVTLEEDKGNISRNSDIDNSTGKDDIAAEVSKSESGTSTPKSITPPDYNKLLNIVATPPDSNTKFGATASVPTPPNKSPSVDQSSLNRHKTWAVKAKEAGSEAEPEKANENERSNSTPTGRKQKIDNRGGRGRRGK